MREAEQLLESACAALSAGDPEACHKALESFRARIASQTLDPDSRAACEAQLARLRGLAAAALEGLDSARAWMRDLSAVLGGLDVYDRGGRQRVATGLSPRAHRF